MNIPQNQTLALFIGAGAVKNSWTPVLRAIQPQYLKRQISPEVANGALARLIYLLRWSSSFGEDKDKYGFQDYKAILDSTKEQIAKEIVVSIEKKEITIQDEFNTIITNIVSKKFEKLMIVSTNWDTVFEDSFNELPIIKQIFEKKIMAVHLHGIYSDPTTLYLPTEVVDEPYRSKEEESILGKMFITVMDEIEKANIIILYGLSLSPLDAELTQLLSTTINNDNLKSVIIIDPEHRKVADKICLLLAYPFQVSIYGYDPKDLNNRFDHSFH